MKTEGNVPLKIQIKAQARSAASDWWVAPSGRERGRVFLSIVSVERLKYKTRGCLFVTVLGPYFITLNVSLKIHDIQWSEAETDTD